MTDLEKAIEQIEKEFKVNSDGTSTSSIRGAARLGDIDQSGLSKSLKTGEELNSENYSKLVKFLVIRGFQLEEIAKWGDTGIPDLGVAAILEYYAFEAGRYCTEQAKLAYRAFATIGIRKWVQDIKGWKQPIENVNGCDYMKSNLVLEPIKHLTPYRKSFRRAYKALYNRNFGDSNSGDRRVVGHWVWNFFCTDPDFAEQLRELNPILHSGFRKYCHYEMLTPELKTWLDSHVETVTDLMFEASEYSISVSKNRKQFSKLMHQVVRTDKLISNLIIEQRSLAISH